MTNFGDWLKPTLLGPMLTMWTLATLVSLTIGMAAVTGGRLDTWLQGMLIASFFAAGLVVLLLAADLFLLKMKWRKLPTGTRAWISSILSPFAVMVIWNLPFFPPPSSVLGLVLFITVPMSLGALGVRMLFGERV
jgi:hypothetical protein